MHPARTIVILIFLALIIEVILFVYAVPSYLAPRPSAVIVSVLDNIETIVFNLAHTAVNIILGMLFGALFGVSLGVILTVFKSIADDMNAILMGFNSIPLIAFAPIIVVWFGIGVASKIAMAALLSFFPYAILSQKGFQNLSIQQEMYIKQLNAKKWRLFLFVRFPAARRHLVSATRLAIPLASVGALVGEFISSEIGIGHIIIISLGQLKTDLTFASLLILALFCVLLFIIFERIFEGNDDGR